MKIIKETYKLQAEILHALTDDEYAAFKKMDAGERFEFFKDKDRSISGEELFPIGRTSKFKLLKLSDMSEIEILLASRITDTD